MSTLLETTFARLEKHFQNNDCAFISACRKENTPEENNIATNNLAHDLQILGYGYIKINGGYIESIGKPDERAVIEKSFAVFNNNDPTKYHTDFKRDMIGLCNEYNQDSVFIKMKNESGHYYDKEGNPFGNFNNISKENIEEFFSRLRNTTFKFTEADEVDNMEDYWREKQTFGTRVLRSLRFRELANKYPFIFSADTKNC